MSSAVVVASVISAVSALGIGGVIGQFVGGARERRDLRSRLFLLIAECDEAMWNPARIDYSTFQTRMRQLHAACLIAQVPRGAAEKYAVMAKACYFNNKESLERSDDGGIETLLSDATRRAAVAIINLAWTPNGLRRSRWAWNRWRIHRARKKIRSEDSIRNLEAAEKFSMF